MKSFTKEDLINEYSMRLLKKRGTETGQRLYAFILETYDMEQIQDWPLSITDFINACVECFTYFERCE